MSFSLSALCNAQYGLKHGSTPVVCYLGPMAFCGCRDLLLALHNVPQEYSEASIKGVLDELTPHHVRIMWSSKLFQVSLLNRSLYHGKPDSGLSMAFKCPSALGLLCQRLQHHTVESGEGTPELAQLYK